MNDCIFCKIISGNSPSSKIYEDDLYIVILDKYPFSTGHALVIPKTHHASIKDIDDLILQQLFVVAKKASNILSQNHTSIEGFNYVMSDGEIAGQEVFHAHLHIIPRYKNDGLKILKK